MLKKFLSSFVLVEFLVVIVVLTLMLGLIYSGFLLNQRASQEGETLAEISQNTRVILERIIREIRQTKEIVTELSEQETGATSTIMFEDGHILESYHYINYFKDNSLVKRQVIGYYFSGDIEENLVPWDSVPPIEQTLEIKILEEPQIIGEYANNLKFWGSKLIQIGLTLEKKGKSLELKTKVFCRNL